MKKLIISSVVAITLSSAVVHAAEHEHKAASPAVEHEHKATAPAAGVNPVKAEMRLLDDAFKNLIDCLILNTPEGIEEPFHEVHKAKANTEAALEKGEIKLPKNGDKMKQFVEMDEQFHHKLEILIEASRKKDMKAVQEVTHKLLNGCVQCHSKFRN